MRVFILVIGLVGFMFGSVQAQFNLNTGFSFSAFTSLYHNDILDQYDKEHPKYSDKFNGLQVMFGPSFGVSYAFGSTVFDLNYQYMAGKTKSSGQDENNELYAKSLFYTTNGLALGLTQKLGKFGIGGNFGFDFLKIKTNSSVDNTKLIVIDDYAINSKFYITFDIYKSDNLNICVRPYAQIFWDDYYLGNLATDLNGVLKPDQSYLDRFRFYGLSLILHNGRQNNY